MITDFLRSAIGVPPDYLGISDLPVLLEYICALCILVVLMISVYMVFSNVLRIFVRR